MTITKGPITSAQRLRQELLEAMIALEAVISSPASAPSWPGKIEQRAMELQIALGHHIADVEGPDGVITQVEQDAPWLDQQAELLRAEHVELTQATREVLWEVDRLSPEPEIAEVAALRESALELLGRVSRHRQRGVDFVYDAYDLDIGGRG
jgi:hypothetical protein